jgi:hypothetical protein
MGRGAWRLELGVLGFEFWVLGFGFWVLSFAVAPAFAVCLEEKAK